MSGVYQPPGFAGPVDLDLSKNEGSPSITRLDLTPEQVATLTARYPDTSSLSRLVATRHGVPEERVLVTAGGDDALFRCFLSAGGATIVATTPTFEMIRRYAEQVQAPLIEIPWWDGDFPVDDFAAAGPDEPQVAVVVSPNNPTGSVLTQADLRKITTSFELVVLDAAYAEFADEDLTPAALEMGNVVVLRTLSKAFGLAGLRVGYAVGPEEVIGRLAACGSPYSMSGMSAMLAARVLSDGFELAETFAAAVATNRASLTEVLDELGCAPLPSQGNFVLATDVDPSWLVPAAASLGVGLRRFTDNPELSRCVRITVPGGDDDFKRLVATLRTVLSPETLLFDMDGVLADVRDSYRAAIVATAARFGVEVSAADIAAAKARGNAADDWELTRGLCAAAGADVDFDTVREEFERIYHGDGHRDGLKTKESLLVDRAKLERWSHLMPLGIVTARPRQDASEYLERFAIADCFQTLVTREDAPSKPDPTPVRLALERLGVTRGWMFGDTVDDLAAARAAGVVPIAVAVPGDDHSVLRSAARVVGSVNEIEEVLDATQR